MEMKKHYMLLPLAAAVIAGAVLLSTFAVNSSLPLPGEGDEAPAGREETFGSEAGPGHPDDLNRNYNTIYAFYESDIKSNPARTARQDSLEPGYIGDDQRAAVKGAYYVANNPAANSGHTSATGSQAGIDQEAGTAKGTVKSYKNISGPWSGAYLHEKMTVVGMAEIKESFRMDNMKPGPRAPSEWFDPF